MNWDAKTYHELRRILLHLIGDTRECPKCQHAFVPEDQAQREAISALKEYFPECEKVRVPSEESIEKMRPGKMTIIPPHIRWFPASDPPHSEKDMWSEKVVSVTNLGNLFWLSATNGAWQRPREFMKGEEVAWWFYSPFEDAKKTTNIYKPPIGVMPENLWKEKRVSDLIRAINAYVESSHTTWELLGKWSKELSERISELQEVKP